MLLVTDSLKYRESTSDPFQKLSLSANFDAPVPISEGGTGADNAADARINLGVDGLQLKSVTIDIILSQQTWTTSGAGMYYIASSASIPIPGATKVVAVSLNADWSGLRKTDLIIPYINGNKVSLLSNVNSFYNSNSLVGVDVLYY